MVVACMEWACDLVAFEKVVLKMATRFMTTHIQLPSCWCILRPRYNSNKNHPVISLLLNMVKLTITCNLSVTIQQLAVKNQQQSQICSSSVSLCGNSKTHFGLKCNTLADCREQGTGHLPAERICCQIEVVSKVCDTAGLWTTLAWKKAVITYKGLKWNHCLKKKRKKGSTTATCFLCLSYCIV